MGGLGGVEAFGGKFHPSSLVVDLVIDLEVVGPISQVLLSHYCEKRFNKLYL